MSKTIISKQQRMTLAREAESRLAENQNEETGLSRLYDQLILAMLAVFDAYDETRPFYQCGVRVDTCKFVSWVMSNNFSQAYEPSSVLDLWKQLTYTPDDMLGRCQPSATQHAALMEVTYALNGVMDEITCKKRNYKFDSLADDWWYNDWNYLFGCIYWNFIRLTLDVQIHEIDILFDHYETWRDDWEEGGFTVGFCFDATPAEYRKMWEGVKSKYLDSNIVYMISQCDSCIRWEIADSPQAFTFKSPRNFVRSIGRAIKSALQAEFDLKMEYDNKTMSWFPGFAIEDAFGGVRRLVIDYFRRARSLCKPTSQAYRKWLEAEAEIIAHFGVEADPITPDVAERIVSLANAAARERWIEDRINANAGEKDAETDEYINAIPVRITDIEKSVGRSLRAALQDPGGRPPKTHGGAKIMTQAEMAAAFGEPCNEQMVANWEARAAGKKRGANPPDAIYKDEKIIYTSELRLNPTPDNKNRLSALIVEFQSRHRLKDDVGRKALHMKSPETLARMQGVIQKETRKLHQNP